MESDSIVLTGMGHFFPENILDNDFFASLDIDSSAEWINERVGIKERRSVLTPEQIRDIRFGKTTREQLVAEGKLMTMAEMSKSSWETAAKRANFSDRHIYPDLVLSGSSVPDWDIPANASSIAGELGFESCAFDVNSACSSFVTGLHVASGLLKSDRYNSATIFNAERYTTRMDYSDRSSCVLFGDSATAAILEKSAEAPGLELVDTILRSNPAGYKHVQIPDGGTFSQNGRAVQKFAITKTTSVTLELLAKNNLTKDDISWFIGHQANLRMLTSACEKQGIGADRHLFNVDQYGNQGAAGAPAVLSSNWDRFKPGEIVVVAVVGSGLTWGAALFKVR